MKLNGEELVFGNETQRLIVKRLEEDYKKIAKLKYLKGLNKEEHKEMLAQCDMLKEEMCRKDKYNKSLIQIKINNIIEEIVRPIMENKKKFYEDNFKVAIYEKRQEYLIKAQKKFKGRQIVLPF